MKRLGVDIPDETHRELKARCATEGVKVSDVVRKLIEEYLQKGEKKKPKQ
jgi:hypothetical protein